jgi:hypothetical protein
MPDSLTTYLHDHMAGANFGVDLLATLADQNSDNPLGPFAYAMRVEVEKDREVLRNLIERTGDSANAVKEAAGWLSEKISRAKLAWSNDKALGTFEALEAISLGAAGKLALWQALMRVAPEDPRLSYLDLKNLAERAEKQRAQIEERRLAAAVFAFRPVAEKIA